MRSNLADLCQDLNVSISDRHPKHPKKSNTDMSFKMIDTNRYYNMVASNGISFDNHINSTKSFQSPLTLKNNISPPYKQDYSSNGISTQAAMKLNMRQNSQKKLNTILHSPLRTNETLSHFYTTNGQALSSI